MAGHWRHEWIPLDLEAAREKGHGHVPKGWHAPGAVKVMHHHDGQPGDHRDASWIKLANWRDSTDYQTGYKHSDLGKVADFSGTVRERHATGAGWNSNAKQYDWRVFRQRTEREGPDSHGSNWSGDYATGTEATMAKAKSAATAAMKKHRAKHLASGGDVGYGEPLPRGAVARALVHEKLGHTDQGLWHHKGMQLPAFIQHVAKDLHEQRGMPLGEAIATAIEACRRWAKGGGDVKPDTRAKAIAALAEFDRLRAQSRVTRSDPVDDETERAQLTSADINNLPDSDFAYIEPGGKKDSSGKTVPRSLRHFPIHDRAHVANALARAPQSPFGEKAMPKIRARAKELGVGEPAASRAEIMRFYSVDDIHIVSRGEGDGSGRVVEAYAAVFGDPVPIVDQQGEYEEEIDRHAFDDVLARHQRRRGGIASAVRVLYNHGRTMGGQEAAAFQTPLGRPVEIVPDSRGLLTRTEYAKTPHADEILELIRAGAITAQSFVGGIIRSDPSLRGPGDKYRAKGGALQRVRRLALGLREYGPVLYAAYPGAEVLGVRMGAPEMYDTDVASTDAGDYPGIEEETPEEVGELTGGVPEDTTSTRYHAHRLWQLRNEEMCRDAGIVPLRREPA